MFRISTTWRRTIAICLTFLTITAIIGDYFTREIIVEISALAILVIALDLAAGFGGMPSLAHGAIMGTGAYAYAVAGQYGLSPWPAAGAGVIMAGLVGGGIGAVCARTHGIFFIMTTLAFGQMIWTFTFRSDALGGDNGMGGIERVPLPFTDSSAPLSFTLYAVFTLLLIIISTGAILRSPFGRAVQAVQENPVRAAAIGLSPFRIRTISFAISSAIAGVAGVLTAQNLQFVSPELMIWTMSGEALIVLILGGIGTLAGPLVGAIVYVSLKHWAAGWTDHWHLIIGILLILIVLSGSRGIYGRIESWSHHAAD